MLRVLKDRSLKIPRRDHYGDIQWREPTTTRIAGILRNPAYAGAFAYGRTRVRYENGLPTKRRDMPVASQWRALVKDKYPAYVSWDNFERIRDMLQDNRSEYQRRCTRGVPRDGKGLLQGIVYCGHCGRKMSALCGYGNGADNSNDGSCYQYLSRRQKPFYRSQVLDLLRRVPLLNRLLSAVLCEQLMKNRPPGMSS